MAQRQTGAKPPWKERKCKPPAGQIPLCAPTIVYLSFTNHFFVENLQAQYSNLQAQYSNFFLFYGFYLLLQFPV